MKGLKVGISPAALKAKQPVGPKRPAVLPKPAVTTHVSGVEIPASIKDHFHSNQVVPFDHPAREEAAKFVTSVWRKDQNEGRRMSQKLLGIGEEGKDPNAKPGYATIKAEMKASKKMSKLEPGGTTPDPSAASRFPTKQQGQDIQRELSGGLPNKTGVENVKQQVAYMGSAIGSALGLGKAEPKAPKAPKPVDHIKRANEQIKPLMHDIQKTFDGLKQKIHAAAADPTHPENAKVLSEFSAEIDPKTKAVKADNHRVMRQAVESEYVKDPSRFIPRITIDNSKLKNEAIGAWTTPAVVTCPGARQCKAFCFAKNDQIQYKNSLAKRFVNMYARKNPDFEKHINDQLQSMRRQKKVQVKDWEKPFGQKKDAKGRVRPEGYRPAMSPNGSPIEREWKTFRIHDSGDFDTPEDAKRWHNIVAKNPDIQFYAYTKSYAEPNIWQTLKHMHESLPNFKIIQSLGGVDAKVDPTLPHAVIFENEDQLKRAGYVASHNFDSRAADKNNRDVGLVIFGGGKKKYGNLKRHLKFANKVKEKLLNEQRLKHEEFHEPTTSPAATEKLQRSEQIPTVFTDMEHAIPGSDLAHQALQPDSYHQARIADESRNIMAHRAKLRRLT